MSGTRISTTPAPCCGDTVKEPTEQCEDGNVESDDCCSSTCQLDAADTLCNRLNATVCNDDRCNATGTCERRPHTRSCDDGLFCNGADTCAGGSCSVHAGDPCAGGPECADTCDEHDGCAGPEFSTCTADGNAWTPDTCYFGVCWHGLDSDLCGPCEAYDGHVCRPRPASASECRHPTAPGQARLRVRNETLDTRDSLLWSWRRGQATAGSDFGDPTTTHDYALCIYDESGPAPGLILQAHLPAASTCGSKPCWKLRGSPTTGARYRDQAGGTAGLRTIRLRSGTDGRAAVRIHAKGEALPLAPSGPLGVPLRVQLRAENGECWEASHHAAAMNDATNFSANGE
jgi:cysteine-rich repeat protein